VETVRGVKLPAPGLQPPPTRSVWHQEKISPALFCSPEVVIKEKAKIHRPAAILWRLETSGQC